MAAPLPTSTHLAELKRVLKTPGEAQLVILAAGTASRLLFAVRALDTRVCRRSDGCDGVTEETRCTDQICYQGQSTCY